MTTGNTTLLGLALPVEGELDGTWGDVVNDSITSLIDSAVAGTTTISADADVTLTTTALAANQARQAVLLWTASNGATTRNITAPAQSKPYIVINAGTGSVVLRGAGPTTGITIVAGERCVAAWSGSDFVKVSSSTATGSVTSVALSMPTGFSVANSPVTSSGTLAVSTTLSGVLKGTGSGFAAATAGTDYLVPPSGTALLKANSGGALANATAGTDYLAPPSGTALLKANSGGALANAVAGTDYVAPGGALGTPSSGTLTNCTADGTSAVGYRNIPNSGSKTTSYTLATSDVGKYVQIGTGGSIVIPDATFADGDIVGVFNNTGTTATITCSITTAYTAGVDSDRSSVTISTRGLATILFISGTVCVISGNIS
jgi:hypothetical protein